MDQPSDTRGPRLVGRDYVTPDLRAKLTGQARYAEDFRAEGMLFCKLLSSPMPHARVRRVEAAEALALPGTRAILTADDLPPPAEAMSDAGAVVRASQWGQPALSMEPMYIGAPILAVAAVDELAAAEAIETIKLDLEPLPFVVDPLDSLRPGGPNARTDGNVWMRPDPDPARPDAPLAPVVRELKWTEADFAAAGPDRLPLGRPADQWSLGDFEAGFKKAALVLDETFVTPNVSHQCLETRSTLAYWRGGKLFIHTGTQSTIQTVRAIARWIGHPPDKIVLVSEYTGGGFGSKGTADISLVIPALLAKKTGTPVMMRVTREEEQAIGGARPSLVARLKAGFSREGRLLALDMYAVMDNGPFQENHDGAMAGRMVSLLYQPEAMRWRGVSVLTNTPFRTYQTAPGGMQAVAVMEPLMAKAARLLGLDQTDIRRVNAPRGKAPVGPPGPDGKRDYVTGAHMVEAIDRGAALFDWAGRRAALDGRRKGTKIRGLGQALGVFVAGSVGFDGLIVITPEGRARIHTGIGNLGTESFSDSQRVAADRLGLPWEMCELVWGDTSRHLAWSCISGGSQTIHAMSRAALAAAMAAEKKLKDIAAQTLGGGPDDYVLADGRVVRPGDGQGLSLGQAAVRAMELGGAYDGHEPPEGLSPITRAAVEALRGQGLLAAARDDFPHDGQTHSFVASFAEVEIDLETGMYDIVDFLAVADSGVVVHPRAFGGQMTGRSMLGIGHAIGQKWVYDRHWGYPLARRFYHTRPPTILDAPRRIAWDALGIPDPETPTGARGIGEPPVGPAFAAVLNALSDALGDGRFLRGPVTADMVVNAIENPGLVQGGLRANV